MENLFDAKNFFFRTMENGWKHFFFLHFSTFACSAELLTKSFSFCSKNALIFLKRLQCKFIRDKSIIKRRFLKILPNPLPLKRKGIPNLNIAWRKWPIKVIAGKNATKKKIVINFPLISFVIKGSCNGDEKKLTRSLSAFTYYFIQDSKKQK